MNKIFDKLAKIGIINSNTGQLNFKEYLKLKSSAYMDLNIDHLSHKDKDEYIVISMAHNFLQNGDVMADPDMEIRIFPESKTVEALTYQLDSMGIYNCVYNQNGTPNMELKSKLNTFLDTWLTNLIKQGFYHDVTAISSK